MSDGSDAEEAVSTMDDKASAPLAASQGTKALRRDVTREKLLTTAYNEFREAGYLKTTIKGVCEKAGFTRGAFYSNFRSKEELIEAIYLQANQRQSHEIRKAVVETLSELHALNPSSPVEIATVIPGALRRLQFGSTEEARWYGLVTELRGASVRHAEARRVLQAAQEDLYRQLEVVLGELLERTSTRLLLPLRDVVILAVGLYEQELGAVSMGQFSEGENGAAKALERLLQVIAMPKG
ncbi:TetR/AcrR family transcriptional regulator [Tessaracoccus antarcticus]|uniref:TetR/AcrR family transcriptional regulator n=1 Tax=Tessaracoccus antarcticus TaxID=2479848 RepID=A0A3M0G534_9ACTN|nr:TetR/AcrR family transcriptional regulator [Tessaracoccus antarcticus]RMB59985.1 TetR/AcrR family transcriptional regulator [Tessaracoccus antarcticus]